jgi:hypothetical protein
MADFMQKRFSHPIDKVDVINPIHEAMVELGDKVDELPPGREKALVLTKLEEAMMWIRMAIARS